MATTMEIINGISQVLANSHDGALDESGEPIEIGLRREEGNMLVDARVMDGFGAHIKGDRLCILYHAEIPLKEVADSKFESDVDGMVEKVASFIKKEFKKVTGSALSLSDPSEIDVLVEYISRIRTSVKAYKTFKIGSLESEAIRQGSKDRLDSATRKWLELGGSAKKPSNVTRKS